MTVARHSTSIRRRPILGALAAVIMVFALLPTATTASAGATPQQGTVVAWGSDAQGQSSPPTTLGDDVIDVAAGWQHSLALHADGTVTAWGNNTFGQATVPPGLDDVTAIAAGGDHNLVLHADGTVTAWGRNGNGQGIVPADLGSDVTAIAAGGFHNLALHDDGTVTAWGYNDNGQTDVPTDLSNDSPVTAIAAGGFHSLVLHEDGTVTAWGWNLTAQPPAGLEHVTTIAAGRTNSLALHEDGTVTAWGKNSFGQSTVPEGLDDVIDVAAGNFRHSLALRANGTVVAWGDNGTGQTDVPEGLHDVTAIAAGGLHNLAIVAPDPAQQIADTRTDLAGMGIHHGITNALDAKLRAADQALTDGDVPKACESLQALINQTRAQTGKKITTDQATRLTEAATTIRDDLGCATTSG